jgi:hypothetical protein
VAAESDELDAGATASGGALVLDTILVQPHASAEATPAMATSLPRKPIPPLSLPFPLVVYIRTCRRTTQTLAQVEGVDVSDHGQWDAWLQGAPASPRSNN